MKTQIIKFYILAYVSYFVHAALVQSYIAIIKKSINSSNFITELVSYSLVYLNVNSLVPTYMKIAIIKMR